SATIEQTNVLASMWFCVARQPAADDPKRRHEDLIEVLSHGTLDEAAEAMRAHIAVGLRHTMRVLEPYFRLRKMSGKTFSRAARPDAGELHDFKIAGEVK